MKKEHAKLTYRVTVTVAGNETEIHVVNAPREGMAKTLAMALYRQSLRKQEVQYDVAVVDDDESKRMAAENDRQFAEVERQSTERMGLRWDNKIGRYV